jgi:hypothetical protein
VRRVKSTDVLKTGMIVLARVSGRVYLHKITAVDYGRHRVQIGNNRGGINGWTAYEKVYGIYRPDGDTPRQKPVALRDRADVLWERAENNVHPRSGLVLCQPVFGHAAGDRPGGHRVGGTRVPKPPAGEAPRRAVCISGTTESMGRNSTGRVPVSKTGGWGFESLRPCEAPPTGERACILRIQQGNIKCRAPGPRLFAACTVRGPGHGPLAHLVEHLFCNQEARSSSLRWSTGTAKGDEISPCCVRR